jgi:hypothetical protein
MFCPSRSPGGSAAEGRRGLIDDPPAEPMPRWIPIAVIGGALLIAVAVAVVIGIPELIPW